MAEAHQAPWGRWGLHSAQRRALPPNPRETVITRGRLATGPGVFKRAGPRQATCARSSWSTMAAAQVRLIDPPMPSVGISTSSIREREDLRRDPLVLGAEDEAEGRVGARRSCGATLPRGQLHGGDGVARVPRLAHDGRGVGPRLPRHPRERPGRRGHQPALVELELEAADVEALHPEGVAEAEHGADVGQPRDAIEDDAQRAPRQRGKIVAVRAGRERHGACGGSGVHDIAPRPHHQPRGASRATHSA